MSSFDYDAKAEFNGGTIIINGQEVSEIPQSMMGGGMRGAMGGMRGSMNGETNEMQGGMRDGMRGGKQGSGRGNMNESQESSTIPFSGNGGVL